VRSDSDEYDSDDSRDTAGVNVIIKTYNDSAKSVEKDTNTGLRRRRKPATSNDEGANGLSNSIYVQRELDIQELQNLKNQVKRLKSTLEEEERKNHFLKLELCNAQVDATDLKQVLSMRDNKIKNLENAQNADWWKIITLKMFIGLLVLLYIYIVLF
jgi:chromosome segregation ATPase